MSPVRILPDDEHDFDLAPAFYMDIMEPHVRHSLSVEEGNFVAYNSAGFVVGYYETAKEAWDAAGS